MAATVQQLQDLRAEIQMTMSAERDSASASVEARIQSAGRDVSGRANEKFIAIEAAFAKEQARLTEVFAEAENNFKKEQKRLNDLLLTEQENHSQELEGLKVGVKELAGANLSEVVKAISEQNVKILAQDGREQTRVTYLMDSVRNVTDSQTRAMGMMSEELTTVKARMNELAMAGPDRHDIGSDSGNRRGPHTRPLRVPDIGNWKLKVFHNDAPGSFLEWRKEFDIQLGNVWAGLDNVLEEIRDSTAPIDESTYEDLLAKHDCLSGADVHAPDWKFQQPQAPCSHCCVFLHGR